MNSWEGDEKVVEILAKGYMGWHRKRCPIELNGTAEFWVNREGKRQIKCLYWDPLTDLNAIHEVEERLTEEQWRDYVMRVRCPTSTRKSDFYLDDLIPVCHADARTKAYALAEMLSQEGDD